MDHHILVIEDDPAIGQLLSAQLAGPGTVVEVQRDGLEGLRRAAMGRWNLYIVDRMLPDTDGLALCRALRHRDAATPVIFLTARDTETDRIEGLDAGADDYIGKPFDPRELRARVKSVLRRMQAGSAAEARSQAAAAPATGGNPRRVPMAGGTLDVESHQLFDRDGREVAITTMEFDLLRVFAAHPNQVLSRDRLLTLTRNREWEPFDRSIDIRIARLRRKIEADPENPQAIRTVRGVGYMYVPPLA